MLLHPLGIGYSLNDKNEAKTDKTKHEIGKKAKGDILFLEELLSNDSPSLPENESFHFDVPSFPHSPAKPLDDDDVYFDIEPDKGVFTKVGDDISDNSTR
ncbi:hypothetical protein Tco_0253154 [Tanacetum coccineum]